MAAAKKSSSVFEFEAGIKDLGNIVEQMEKGDLKLEDALTLFEKGVKLTREAEAALKAAEQKVQILLKEADGNTLKDFDTDADDK